MFRGNGYAFAIGQLGAISFDEFLKSLEFSDRRPGSRCQTADPRGSVTGSQSIPKAAFQRSERIPLLDGQRLRCVAQPCHLRKGDNSS